MKLWKLGLLLGMLCLFACKKETVIDPLPETCDLEQEGILGNWEMIQRSTDGAESPICCSFLGLTNNDNSLDCKGNFRSVLIEGERAGSFELDQTNRVIHFSFVDGELFYNYELNSTELTFEYEEDGIAVVETWRKQ